MTENKGTEQFSDNEVVMSAAVGSTDNAVEQSKKYLIALVVAVVAVVGGYLGYNAYQTSQKQAEEQVSNELSKVMPLIASGNWQAALSGEAGVSIQAIADKNMNTEAGKLAALYTAQALILTGKTADAEKYVQGASQASAPEVRVGAIAGQAVIKESSGNLAEAAELYLKAASEVESSGLVGQYKLFAGILYEDAGKKEEAKKIYQSLLDDPKLSVYSSEAKEGLARLGVYAE